MSAANRNYTCPMVSLYTPQETNLGSPIVTEPYVDGVGSEGNWVVTLARAVYQDCDSTILGVVGVDVRLEQVQSSIERTRFLVTGYSILATAEGESRVSGVGFNASKGSLRKRARRLEPQGKRSRGSVTVARNSERRIEPFLKLRLGDPIGQLGLITLSASAPPPCYPSTVAP